MKVEVAEAALLQLFADLDAERWDELSTRLDPDVQLADELTGSWLRGADRVARYLQAQRGVVTDIRSTPTDVRAATMDEEHSVVTFDVVQVYRLDGEERRERMTGCVIFCLVQPSAPPRLALFHLGAVGSAPGGQSGPTDVEPVEASPSGPELGELIRARRQSLGVSLRAFASRAQLSASFLSQLERGQADPSVATLRRLADAFGVAPTDLLPGKPDDGRQRVGLAAHRPRVALRGAGLLLDAFASLPGGELEAFITRLEPERVLGDLHAVHEGEEFIYVFSGQLEADDGVRPVLLQGGDGMFLRAKTPRRLRSVGPREARFLTVQTPASAPAE